MARQTGTLEIIESSVSLEQCGDDRIEPVRLQATFSYDPSSPFAVTLVIYDGPSRIAWRFARDLLVDGMFTEVGSGDVAVFPSLDAAANACTVIELRSPHGEFMGQIPTRQVICFVQATTNAVPVGSESDLVDIDALVEQLLADD
jgi:hypothetical protein